MEIEAAKAGFYEGEFGRFPRLQILAIKELFDGKRALLPLVEAMFRKTAAEPTAICSLSCLNKELVWRHG